MNSGAFDGNVEEPCILRGGKPFALVATDRDQI